MSVNNPYITDEQINEIIKVLIHQCDLIEKNEKQSEHDYPELYDADYMKGRHHSFTGKIFAGFNENTNIPGMTVSKRKYGRNHYQPDIESATAVVQIYGKEATLKIDEVKLKCASFNSEDSDKKYFVLQFRTSKKGHLTKVDFVSFDVNGAETLRQEVYKYKAEITRVA